MFFYHIFLHFRKRLSNGDVGEATDESTTYDVEEEENIGTVSYNSIAFKKYQIIQYSFGKKGVD